MNHDELQIEIAQHEQWLAGVLPARDAGAEEALKLRLQIELNEQWLAAQGSELSGEEPISVSLRRSVRREVALTSTEKTKDQSGTNSKAWHWLSATGLGLAAMLFLSVSVFRAAPVQVTQSAQVAQSESNADVSAFEYDSEEEDIDDQLDDAFAKLEDLVASRDETGWDDDWGGL